MKATARRATQPNRSAIKRVEMELKTGAKILEWEMGDVWGHVGSRLPENRGIAVQMFRRPEQGRKDIQVLSSTREKLFKQSRVKMSHSAEWNYYADKIRKGERWTRGWV